MKTAILAAALVATATPSAAEYDTDVLHERGAWRTEITASPDAIWCSAVTDSDLNSFSLTIYPNGSLHLLMMVHTPAGFFADSTADALVDVDDNRWRLNDAELTGDGPFGFISFGLGDERASEFLADLAQGAAVALKTSDGQRNIAAWSLRGSSAAFSALTECASRIAE